MDFPSHFPYKIERKKIHSLVMGLKVQRKGYALIHQDKMGRQFAICTAGNFEKQKFFNQHH